MGETPLVVVPGHDLHQRAVHAWLTRQLDSGDPLVADMSAATWVVTGMQPELIMIEDGMEADA